MPLSLHAGTTRPAPGIAGGLQVFSSTRSSSPSYQTNPDHWVRMSLGDMIFSGVFERFPKLQVGAVEQELSWAPHFIERMDYVYTQRMQRPHWHRFKGKEVPSYYFHRNVFLSFQEDALGIQLRKIIGVNNLLWGSNYPHMEGTFPRSAQFLKRILKGCTAQERRKITRDNTVRVYGLNVRD